MYFQRQPEGEGNYPNDIPSVAQPGIAADRFAREIIRFLTVLLERARGS